MWVKDRVPEDQERLYPNLSLASALERNGTEHSMRIVDENQGKQEQIKNIKEKKNNGSKKRSNSLKS